MALKLYCNEQSRYELLNFADSIMIYLPLLRKTEHIIICSQQIFCLIELSQYF